MATNTLLQYLQSDDGSGVALGITPSNRRQVERFIASGTIAAGDIVCLDITKTADGDKSLFVTKAKPLKHRNKIAKTFFHAGYVT